MEKYYYCGTCYLSLYPGQSCPKCYDDYQESKRRQEQEKQEKERERRKKERLQNYTTNSSVTTKSTNLFKKKKENKKTISKNKSKPKSPTEKPSSFSVYAGNIAFLITTGYLFFVLKEDLLPSLVGGVIVGFITLKAIEPIIMIAIILLIISILAK